MVGVWLSRILENSEEVESRVQTARSCTARIPIFVLRFCDEIGLRMQGHHQFAVTGTNASTGQMEVKGPKRHSNATKAADTNENSADWMTSCVMLCLN
jgi:hypothetical protein